MGKVDTEINSGWETTAKKNKTHTSIWGDQEGGDGLKRIHHNSSAPKGHEKSEHRAIDKMLSLA